MAQWRMDLLAKVVDFFSWLQLKISRVNLVVEKPKFGEIDYSYYLGKDFKMTYNPPQGKVPSYLLPHCSALDGPCITRATAGKISFVAGDFIKGWPFFGFVAQAIKCIFVPRGGSP